MIIVTGGAGFIGSNLVRALNARGRDDILIVDNLHHGRKFRNLIDCNWLDYMDKDEFLEHIQWGTEVPDGIEAIFHLGACTNTTEQDGRHLMRNNYSYSKAVLRYCMERNIRLIYASSASVYGAGRKFAETREHEAPLNAYGFSKFAFDQHVRRQLARKDAPPVFGLRYFNVYGPRESHKGAMASVVWHFHRQVLEQGTVRLFCGGDGFADGEQCRDFVHVDDVVAATLWFAQAGAPSGIYNVGTGRSQTFNEVARAVLSLHQRGEIEYIPFPDALRGSYQSHTQADLTRLRAAGYTGVFKTVEEGVPAYLDWLRTRPEFVRA
ncbi:MAG TPA: ADP-glyceromanno-heptose 6-epimerase [Gammaproteobacteria bacterium]|nr:ADP-glyceromanno-heptose 6-epimerase [Gammaproteobacteria bacterium]